ncbi:short chain dehydrogenase [Ceratobasidium sp. AG-Ba]|nr:short chain dehydrogenase [Ceratobasidium sp. AG-Ba]
MSTSDNITGTQEIETALKSLSSDLTALATLTESKLQEHLYQLPAEELNIWKESAFISIQRLKDVISIEHVGLTVTERARLVFMVSTFVGEDEFIDDRCRALAIECLGSFIPLDRTTASQVLLVHLKPIFQGAVHPGVRQDTGRAQQNPLDVQNMYDEQPWKFHGIGSWNTLAWVLSHLESDSFESLWPLIIPPLLTLVDDYDPAYKIRGIAVTNALLQRISASLLHRTGIDELLFKALQSALQNLTSDQSPTLLRAAMPCYLSLTNLVLNEDSIQKFEKLCAVVTDTIVPGWLYASSRVELMVASVDVLLLIIQALGIGSARFLKAFIPQLTENILPKEFSPVESTLELRIASAKTLLTLMRNSTRNQVLIYYSMDIKNLTLNEQSDALKEIVMELFTELLVSSNDLLMASYFILLQESKLDVLINNAAEFLPPVDAVTKDGYDLVFGVNCVATCFLTLCLLPCLLKTSGARIISMVGEDHRLVESINYSSVIEGEKRLQLDPLVNHAQSKLGLMLFTNELHRRYHKQGLVAVSVHPGTVKSNRYKHQPFWLVSILHLFMYPSYMGAITPLWAATSPAGADLGGRYCLPWARVGMAEKWAEDPEKMAELWSWIIQQTNRYEPGIMQFRE